MRRLSGRGRAVSALMALWLVACTPHDHVSLRPGAGDALSMQVVTRLSDAVAHSVDCVAADGDEHIVDLPASTSDTVTLRALEPATTYACTLARTHGAASDPDTFTTDALPDDLQLPTITVPADDPVAHGLTLFNSCWSGNNMSVRSEYIVLLDSLGVVRWYYAGRGCFADDATWTADQTVFIGGQPDVYTPRHIDLDGDVLFDASPDPVVSGQDVNGFSHDAGPSEDGRSIFAITTSHTGFQGFVLEEIDLASGAVVWTWEIGRAHV